MEFTFEPVGVSGGKVADDLRDLIEKVNSPDLMEAVGLQVAALWKRAFDEPDLRPSEWPPRKGVQPAGPKEKGKRRKRQKGDHPLMKETGHFWRSPKPTTWTTGSVTVSADVPYAAIHQFGGSVPTRHKGYNLTAKMNTLSKLSYFIMPPRPTFPITPDGKLTDKAEAYVFDVVDGFLDAE